VAIPGESRKTGSDKLSICRDRLYKYVRKLRRNDVFGPISGQTGPIWVIHVEASNLGVYRLRLSNAVDISIGSRFHTPPEDLGG